MRVGQILSLALVMLFSWSCDDEPAQIGDEIFGGNLIDTEMYITSGDDLKAQNVASGTVDFKRIIDYLMLGEYDDPIYGSIKADFASELSIGLPKKDMAKETIEYVGTELRLQFQRDSWIGDTMAMHKISVYELFKSERLDPDYKSDFDPTGKYNLEPIGTDTFFIEHGVRDTIWQVSGYTNKIAIKISDDVGKRFFEADSVTINNKESFKNLFSGLYVTTELLDKGNTPGSILRIPYALTSNLSQELAVLYRKKKITVAEATKDTTITWDTIPMLFPINKEATKAIRYIRNYTNSLIDLTDDTDYNVDKLYLQGLGGTMAKVNITESFMNEWKGILDTTIKSPINSIAAVEMSFYVDTITDKDENYLNNIPKALTLYILDENGNYVIPTFDTPQGSYNAAAFSGGAVLKTIDGAIKYTFTIQRGFFEEFIYPSNSGNSQKNYSELYLGIPYPNFNFNRVILHGMDIEKGEENKSIMPSNMTIKYVVVE